MYTLVYTEAIATQCVAESLGRASVRQASVQISGNREIGGAKPINILELSVRLSSQVAD